MRNLGGGPASKEPRHRTGVRRRRPPPISGFSRTDLVACRWGRRSIDTARRRLQRAQGGAPALQSLGQHIVRSLLRHQAVVDNRGSAPGRGRPRAEQPGPRTASRSGQLASFIPARSGRVGRGRTGRPLRARGPREDTSVGVAREWRSATHIAGARPWQGAWSVASTAADRRTIGRRRQRRRSCPAPGGPLKGRRASRRRRGQSLVRSRPARPLRGPRSCPPDCWLAGPVRGRREPGSVPAAAPCGCPRNALPPERGTGQVNKRSPGRPQLKQRGKRGTHLGACPRARRPCGPRQGEAHCGVRRDRPDRGWRHDGSITPLSTHASKACAAGASPRSPSPWYGSDRALIGLPRHPTHRDRG